MKHVEKKSLWLLFGLMGVVFVSSIVMAQSVKFLVVSAIGYVLMTGISFFDYRKIQRVSSLILALALLAVFLLFIYFLMTDFFGWNYRERMIFLHVLSIVALFLYAVLLYKKIGKELARKKLLNWKKVRELVASYPVIFGTTTGVAVFGVINIVLLNKENIVVFFTKTGKRAYIYEVLTRFWNGSKWFGKGFEKREIVSWIPECEGTCILTNYIASYGKITGVFLVSLLLFIFVKILYDIRNAELLGRILATGSGAILFIEMMIVTLENLQLIPCIAYSVYLPFYSQKIVGIICSYVLMGIVLSVYRYGWSDEMGLNL